MRHATRLIWVALDEIWPETCHHEGLDCLVSEFDPMFGLLLGVGLP